MYRNYLKIAFRNLLKNKASTLINIGGLAVGMAVAMLIGLWIWDELSYDRYHANFERIAQVMQHNVYNGVVETQVSNPAVMAEEIRDKYGSDFKYVLQSSWNFDHTLAHQDKKTPQTRKLFRAPGDRDAFAKNAQGHPRWFERTLHHFALGGSGQGLFW